MGELRRVHPLKSSFLMMGRCILTEIGQLYLCATKIGASSSDINASATLW